MKYWITTDTHFGHELLIREKIRPSYFAETVLRKLKQALEPDDVLIHLGDVSFKDDAMWNAKLMEVSPCKKWLVKGNHDKHSDFWYLSRGWNFVADRIRMHRFGVEIVFSHIPIKDDGYDFNIHGHFHDNDHRKLEPELVAIANDKHVLVALETINYMPITLKRLIR